MLKDAGIRLWGRFLDVLGVTVAILFVVLAGNFIVEDLEDGEWWLLLVDLLVAVRSSC